MPRYRRMNLCHHGYEAVADEVKRAIRGESGLFGVYVATCGTTNVCLLKHKQHKPRPDSELVGAFTQAAPLNVIEDALLARLREINSHRRDAA